MDLQKEWEVAREVMVKADERIQDVRKLGFGFITALLTADAFLLPKVTASVDVVVSVTGVTVLLIMAARLIERQQEILQRVVAGRAVVIERLSCAELSDVVSYRFVRARWSSYGTFLHICLIIGVFFVAQSASPEMAGEWRVGVVCAVGILMLLLLGLFKVEQQRVTDWSLDRIECKQGERVRVLVTNVSRKVLSWVGNTELFAVVDDKGRERQLVPAPEDFALGPGCSRVVEWSPATGHLEPGLYAIRPTNGFFDQKWWQSLAAHPRKRDTANTAREAAMAMAAAAKAETAAAAAVAAMAMAAAAAAAKAAMAAAEAAEEAAKAKAAAAKTAAEEAADEAAKAASMASAVAKAVAAKAPTANGVDPAPEQDTPNPGKRQTRWKGRCLVRRISVTSEPIATKRVP